MITLVNRMINLCIYLREIKRDYTKSAEVPEIHLPKEVYDTLLVQMHPMLTTTTQDAIPKDELRINGVIVKRKP